MSVRKKKIFIATFVIIATLAFYLNRSYAHIYNYDKSRANLESHLVNEYTLKYGEGEKNLTYVAMGDSLTYGLGAPNTASTYPYIIAENLLKKNKAVTVYNLGVVGSTADDVKKNQLPRVRELEPDFVTIMIGTNDFHNFVNKESFRQSLETIIDEIELNPKTKVTLINIPYLGTDQLVLPPYDTVWNKQIKEFNDVIGEVAALKNVEIVDLYSLSYDLFKEDQKKYYSVDEFHPSGEGYILWGKLISGN